MWAALSCGTLQQDLGVLQARFTATHSTQQTLVHSLAAISPCLVLNLLVRPLNVLEDGGLGGEEVHENVGSVSHKPIVVLCQ